MRSINNWITYISRCHEWIKLWFEKSKIYLGYPVAGVLENGRILDSFCNLENYKVSLQLQTFCTTAFRLIRNRVKFGEGQARMRIAKRLQSLQLMWHLLEWLWSKLFNRSALCCTSLSALLFLHHCFLLGAWRCSTWSKRIIQVCSWSGGENKTDWAESTKTRWNSEKTDSIMLFLFPDFSIIRHYLAS